MWGRPASGSALILVVEQSALHVVPAPPHPPVPDRHSAVALLLDETGPVRLTGPALHADVAEDGVAELLAGEVDARRVDRADVAVVLGGQLAARLSPADLPDDVRVAQAGLPFTGPWWELVGGLPGWVGAGRPVLVADYDPALRYFCAFGVEPIGQSQ